VNENRGVWLAIATTLVTGAFAILVAGVTSNTLPLLVVASVLFVIGLGLFAWLLRHTPEATGTLGSVERADYAATRFDNDLPEMPAYAIPAYASSAQEMYQIGPSSWLGPVGARQPAELTLRAAVALPAVNARTYGEEVATRIRGEPREHWLLRTVEESPITTWLEVLSSAWHCNGDASWKIYGSGHPDLTQLVFEPTWDGHSQPLIARVSVLTGWRPQPDGQPIPAIRVATDLMINLIELDSDRQHDSVRHQTTDPPAPGALTLDELAGYLLELMVTAQLAQTFGANLIPSGVIDHGYLGLWIELSGVELHRVIDLRETERVIGASGSAGHIKISEWPIPEAKTQSEANGRFVATLLDEMLEQAGYRGVQHRFDWLRALKLEKRNEGS